MERRPKLEAWRAADYRSGMKPKEENGEAGREIAEAKAIARLSGGGTAFSVVMRGAYRGTPWFPPGEEQVSWANDLFSLVPPRKGRSYNVISAEQYIGRAQYALRNHSGEEDAPGEELVVFGKLRLSDGEWRRIPRAIVLGGASISRCPSLERVNLVVFGKLGIDGCPKLDSVVGEVFGSAKISTCGLDAIGADFRTTGDLSLEACPKLRTVNCEVGGAFIALECGLTRTGPAFRTGGAAKFSGCKNLARLEGSAGGGMRIRGCGGNFERITQGRANPWER